MNNSLEHAQKRLLLIVDPQNDFINGSLPVPGGEAAMNSLAAWLLDNPDRYARIVVTGDNHCPDHCSFIPQNGKGPPHCIAGSHGAKVWPRLQEVIDKLPATAHYLAKGEEVEEYSIFSQKAHEEFLKNLVQNENLGYVEICGLAGDICVLETAKNALRIFGQDKVQVLAQFSPSMDGGGALDQFIREKLQCAR